MDTLIARRLILAVLIVAASATVAFLVIGGVIRLVEWAL